MLDRIRLLVCAILCFVGMMLFGLCISALPELAQIPVLVLILAVETAWYIRFCRKKRLSPWTGKPLQQPCDEDAAAKPENLAH